MNDAIEPAAEGAAPPAEPAGGGKRGRKSLFWLLAVIGILLGLMAWTGVLDSPTVYIRNASSHELTDIVLTGRGFTETLPRLAAGDTAPVEVHPRGESGLAVAFTANGQRLEHELDTYLENMGMYQVAVVVTPELDAIWHYLRD